MQIFTVKPQNFYSILFSDYVKDFFLNSRFGEILNTAKQRKKNPDTYVHSSSTSQCIILRIFPQLRTCTKLPFNVMVKQYSSYFTGEYLEDDFSPQEEEDEDDSHIVPFEDLYSRFGSSPTGVLNTYQIVTVLCMYSLLVS